MKKTGATILSLALALILVSSLGSGVILAKGPSDNASDQGKEHARYHTVRDVGILVCGMSPFPTAVSLFGSFDGPVDVSLPLPGPEGVFCGPNLASLLNSGFRVQDVGTVVAGPGIITSYTTVRTRKERR